MATGTKLQFILADIFNRKILADLAVNDNSTFSKVVKQAVN